MSNTTDNTSCPNQPKIVLEISQNCRHFSQAKIQKSEQAQVKVQTICNIFLHEFNILHKHKYNRKMVLVDKEFEIDEGTFVSDVSVSIHSRPPSDENALITTPATVMASATACATISTLDFNSPITKRRACDRDFIATGKCVGFNYRFHENICVFYHHCS